MTSLHFLGLYLGLIIGGLLFVAVCLVAVFLCRDKTIRKPNMGVRVSDMFGKQSSAERARIQRIKHIQSLAHFGVLNPNSPVYAKDINERHYSWILGQDPSDKGISASQVPLDLDHDTPVFYFSSDPESSTSPITSADLHNQMRDSSAAITVFHPNDTNKPKCLNSKRVSFEHLNPQRNDSNRPMLSYGDRQPTFETFKSESTITVPLITIAVKNIPDKPPRAKPPHARPPMSNRAREDDQPYKKNTTSVDKSHVSAISSSKDNLERVSDYLSDDGGVFAGFDSYDEINGSLV